MSTRLNRRNPWVFAIAQLDSRSLSTTQAATRIEEHFVTQYIFDKSSLSAIDDTRRQLKP